MEKLGVETNADSESQIENLGISPFNYHQNQNYLIFYVLTFYYWYKF